MIADNVKDVSNILNDFIGVVVKYRVENNRVIVFAFDKNERGHEVHVFHAYYYDDDSSRVVVSKEPGTIDVDFINNIIHAVKSKGKDMSVNNDSV